MSHNHPSNTNQIPIRSAEKSVIKPEEQNKVCWTKILPIRLPSLKHGTRSKSRLLCQDFGTGWTCSPRLGFENPGMPCDFSEGNHFSPFRPICHNAEALKVKGRDQGAKAVPHDLNTNTDQQKRRKPYDHDHSVFSNYASE